MKNLKSYKIGGETFEATDCIEGVLINPLLPNDFDNTANDQRPKSHDKFWNLAFIETESVEDIDQRYAEREDEYAQSARANWVNRGRVQWMSSYPTGVRYCVRCLDGGAWDRSTNYGFYAELDEAIEKAKGRG